MKRNGVKVIAEGGSQDLPCSSTEVLKNSWSHPAPIWSDESRTPVSITPGLDLKKLYFDKDGCSVLHLIKGMKLGMI